MSWQKRIRTIALSQLKAIKDRLDSIDADMPLDNARELEARARAEAELEASLGGTRLPVDKHTAGGSAPQSATASASRSVGTSHLSRWYRILGVSETADLSEVEAAYAELVQRCDALDAPEGSEEHRLVEEIRSRVEQAYNELRAALNPAAPRFEKLEIES